jgi:hypothetical protein
MEKFNRKPEEKTTTESNPFDDCFFWLSLAAIDFRFFEEGNQSGYESDREGEKK